MGLILSFLIICTFAVADSSAVSSQRARKLFERLSGVPLLLSDARLATMVVHIDKNDWRGAARIATDDDRFINITIRDWAAVMSNRKESPFVPFNDFQALVMGIVRDGLDARELLTANYRYQGGPPLPAVSSSNSNHYLEMEKQGLNYKKTLVQRIPQWDDVSDAAGLLTTYTWASEHLVAGTNRRSTEFTFQEFLCSPIQKWRDFGMPDGRVRRDVPRTPSGSPETFQTECRTCHALLDGLTGAFANFDFANGGIRFGKNWVAPKMNQNAEVYPQGFEVRDASWINLATEHHNESFGWRSNTAGFGIGEFARMVAHAKAFSGCMVRRAYTKVCRAEPDATLVETLSTGFEENYLLKDLFENVAIHCTQGETL